jgi:uncharacterized membrane protein
MSGTGFEMKETIEAGPRFPSLNRAILFILPSIVITVVSITLFSQLTSFTQPQYNIFAITIIAAIILSLVSMAGMQVLIYRIVEEGGVTRSIIIGITHSFIVSVIISALAYPLLINILHFSITDFLHFSALLFLFSSTWILVSVFWASEKYGHTAVIFILSYLVIFVWTYRAYVINPVDAISGYVCGTAVLFSVFLLTSMIIFRNPKSSRESSGEYSRLTTLISKSSAAIMFNIFYVLAIFLDKIIVWVSQGITTGQGLVVTGAYAEGAFLGLIPMFSIATMAYFARRTKPLVDDRYNGTFGEIQKRIEEYKHIYWSNFAAMLLITLVLTYIVASLSLFLINDSQVLRILLTVSLGSVFFVVIIFNSAVLVIFGKSSTSTYAVLTVIIFELAAIPFVFVDVWYCALGFAIGSFTGFLISFLPTVRLFSNYEYNMFSILVKS